jgi:hypothetical protein
MKGGGAGFEPATSRLTVDNPQFVGSFKQGMNKDIFGALPTELPAT